MIDIIDEVHCNTMHDTFKDRLRLLKVFVSVAFSSLGSNLA